MDRERLRSRLAAYLDGRDPGRSPGSSGPGPLRPLTGGRDSSLYSVALHLDGPSRTPSPMSVLKLYAPDADGAAHAAREWRALTHLHGTTCPTPRAVLFEPDPRPLGRPFVVMDHVPGTSFRHAHEAAPPDERARLTTSFVAPLVALHDRDPSPLDPRDPLPDVRSCLDEELRRIRTDSAGSVRPGITGVAEWLERHLPRGLDQERPVILHRDYHPWNVLVDDAGGCWVVDWDWRIGDARFDLAWTCTLMQRSGFPAFGAAVREEYARQSGHPLGDLGWFEVLTTARWLLNVLPALGSDGGPDDTAERAEFREFLNRPVRHAERFLRERTGVDVALRRRSGDSVPERRPRAH